MARVPRLQRLGRPPRPARRESPPRSRPVRRVRTSRVPRLPLKPRHVTQRGPTPPPRLPPGQVLQSHQKSLRHVIRRPTRLGRPRGPGPRVDDSAVQLDRIRRRLRRPPRNCPDGAAGHRHLPPRHRHLPRMG